MAENLKPGGLGADLLASLDTILIGNKAVRELLAALEKMPAVGDGKSATEIQSKAQATRRVFEDVEDKLNQVKKSLEAHPGSENGSNGNNAQHIHVHLHFSPADVQVGTSRSER